MTVIPGMGYFPDRPLNPPEPPDYAFCEVCDDEVPVIEDTHERTVACAECGEILDAFDWEAEAERRAGW